MGRDHPRCSVPADLGGRRPHRRRLLGRDQHARRRRLPRRRHRADSGPGCRAVAVEDLEPLRRDRAVGSNQAAGQDPQAAKDAAVAAIRALFTGDPAQKAQAENRAADALAKAQGIPVDQAKTQIQDYKKQYDETIATAKVKAEAAAVAAKSAATQGAFYGALALILGALAGFFGGRLGASKLHTLADSYDARRV